MCFPESSSDGNLEDFYLEHNAYTIDQKIKALEEYMGVSGHTESSPEDYLGFLEETVLNGKLKSF